MKRIIQNGKNREKIVKKCLHLTLWIDHQWPSPGSVDDDGGPQLDKNREGNRWRSWHVMMGAQLDGERIVGKRVNHPPVNDVNVNFFATSLL